MSPGYLYPLSTANIPPNPNQSNCKYNKPINQQPTYNSWLPLSQQSFLSNTIEPGYYYPQQPQIIAPRQQFSKLQTLNYPVNNDVGYNKLQQYVNPMQNYRPATNFQSQQLSSLQQPETFLQNYYPISVSPSLNSKKTSQMNIPYKYPLVEIPHPGYQTMYTKGSLTMDIAQQQMYPQYPYMMRPPKALSPIPGIMPMEPIRQQYPDDDIDEIDNTNDNFNTNIKDSKFLQMIMNHLQGLIFKDDEETVQPNEEN